MTKGNFLKITSALLVATTLNLSAKTYATVDGINITEKEIAMVNPNLNINTLDATQKELLINKMIDNVVLTKYALKQDITKSTQFKEALEQLKANLALQAFMENQFKSTVVKEKDARKAFEENKEQIAQNKQVSARHILVKTEDEAKQIIAELSKAKNVQEKFIELAKELSTGPSGKNGGDLGWFSKEKMVPEFSTAAFALNTGEFTKNPVKTQFGYHVIFVQGSSDNFEDIKDGLIKDLTLQKFQVKIDELAKELRKDSKIKINK
ncbi:MAG: Foldase protein PrsA precursor (EC [uncultured Campylobacterales bacterium]|uniref:Foldase protein PrsA (EC) n=1 Tax=uncultured Campylobacterales bacterium TaxID=352960 RepID=A0A6S6SA24_9BACT|nr:MAG: Foldase protein PrsA precursor (EC [uncultured Campylobacterales bacterium]